MEKVSLIKYNIIMKNKIISIDNGIVKLDIGKGLFAFFDKTDLSLIESWNWHSHRFHNNLWRVQGSRIFNGVHEQILMHRLIMNTPKHLVIDHINCIPYDNRRSNLINCTHKENCNNPLTRKHLCKTRSTRIHAICKRHILPTNKKYCESLYYCQIDN